MTNQPVTCAQRCRTIVYPFLLLFWLFCLPLAFSIYTPWPYQTNCHWNERCAQLGEQKTAQSISELTGFFRHQKDTLAPPWTNKEFRHLLEVRGIYDGVFTVFALISLGFLADLAWRASTRQHWHQYARSALFISAGLLVTALLIAPFFSTFWMEVFHPLLFDNELWRTNPRDISWYLMPKAFFLRVIIFICLITLLGNWLLYRLTRPTMNTLSTIRHPSDPDR